eukprot:13443904-Ditylum_brightwellii.AAC.1
MGKKRDSVPNPHPSTRIGSGTDADIDASIGLQASNDSNNAATAIADPNSIVLKSNGNGGIVEPGRRDKKTVRTTLIISPPTYL